MKIGFYMEYLKGPNRSFKGMIGDELYGESMCKFLRKIKGVEHAELYAPNYLPSKKLDFMIYLNKTPPNKNWAKKHVIYLQAFYDCDLNLLLKSIQKKSYDGYLFISEEILNLHKQKGFDGIFLPFGVDTSAFYPREKEKKFAYEVAYVGNDIKGRDRSTKYLLPAASFNFGLYGVWKISKRQWLKRLFGLWKLPYYKKIFIRISKGKIPQDKLPVLYSSSSINLNCTKQEAVDWNATTLRPYEILACKGFLISDRIPVLEKIREGVVFTEGGKDLKEKIEYYLRNGDERKKIAERGYKYVIKNERIEKRMNELCDYLRRLK